MFESEKIVLHLDKSSKVLNVSEYILNSLNISKCIQRKQQLLTVYSEFYSSKNSTGDICTHVIFCSNILNKHTFILN